MHQRIEMALVSMLCALMGFIAHNTIAASAHSATSLHAANNDCWTHGYFSCCLLSKAHMPERNCPDDENPTWTYPSRVVEGGDADVGTWFLAKTTGYSDIVSMSTTDACAYREPLCGTLPGTCIWQDPIKYLYCADFPPPTGEPDCSP